MKTEIVIVGGGASGLVAAIIAARSGGRVTLLEHMDRMGKKLLSTGNGKCNMTNRLYPEGCYRCSQPEFPYEVLKQFDWKETLVFFRGLGILPKDRDGYIYPNSDQASSVQEVLRMEVSRLRITVVTECHVKDISKQVNTGRFFVGTSCGVYDAETVILAAGSKAAPVTGSDGSGYHLAKQLGHRIIEPLPALVQLKCAGKVFKQMAGIRTDGRVVLYGDGKKLAEDRGELQLTDYGISGIPVFQVSRYASVALSAGKKVEAVLDFLPGMTSESCAAFLKKRVEEMPEKTAEEFFVGLIHKKLALALLKEAEIAPGVRAGLWKPKDMQNILEKLKDFRVTVTGTNPFANAQICCGGVDTRELNGKTMESRIVPGLYLAGEIVDVDGICGGYNLQWAWTTGAIAGNSAANRNRRTYDKN